MRASRVLFACAVLVTVAAFAAPVSANGNPLTAAPESIQAPADHPCGVTADADYVRLRGSPVIHLRSCELVKRADPGGVVPAGKNDGPPCIHCRRSEVR